MQESSQNPPPNPPAPAPQDIHWGIAYLRQDVQDLRQDVRQINERFERVYQRQDSHFRWLMGTMITFFVGLSGVIIAAAKL